MEFTIVDGVVVLVLLVSGVLAYSRGVTRELLAIAGWVIAAIASIYFAPAVEPLLKEIPTVGEFLISSCTISKLAAVVVVFAIALIILSIFTPLFSSAVQESPLGPLDRGLGFIFGVARGALLVIVCYLLYQVLVPEAERLPMIEQARSVEMIADGAAVLEENVPTTIPGWIADPVNRLMADCGGVPGLGTDQATTPAESGAATDAPATETAPATDQPAQGN